MRINKLFAAIVLVLLFGGSTVNVAHAQDDAANVFKNLTNPREVCNYYRTNSNFTVVRESDNECLVSVGEGQYTVYTQYYYSGDQWCYQLTQRGQTYGSNCVPIPHSADSLGEVGETVSGFFTNPENKPYVITGCALVGLAIVGSIVSNVRSSRLKASQTTTTDTEAAEKTFDPKVKRSGRGSYGWEEMETTTTEELNAKQPKGPDDVQGQGGVGLHDEPLPPKNIAEELEKLVRLRQKGTITQHEFELAKKKLLQ